MPVILNFSFDTYTKEKQHNTYQVQELHLIQCEANIYETAVTLNVRVVRVAFQGLQLKVLVGSLRAARL